MRSDLREYERCVWPQCRDAPALSYLERLLCHTHWNRLCELDDEGRGAEVDRALSLDRGHTNAPTPSVGAPSRTGIVGLDRLEEDAPLFAYARTAPDGAAQSWSS